MQLKPACHLTPPDFTLDLGTRYKLSLHSLDFLIVLYALLPRAYKRFSLLVSQLSLPARDDAIAPTDARNCSTDTLPPSDILAATLLFCNKGLNIQRMARTKQAAPVRREVSEEYFSREAKPRKGVNGVASPGKREVEAPTEKKEAGVMEVAIAVGGIYASL